MWAPRESAGATRSTLPCPSAREDPSQPSRLLSQLTARVVGASSKSETVPSNRTPGSSETVAPSAGVVMATSGTPMTRTSTESTHVTPTSSTTVISIVTSPGGRSVVRSPTEPLPLGVELPRFTPLVVPQKTERRSAGTSSSWATPRSSTSVNCTSSAPALGAVSSQVGGWFGPRTSMVTVRSAMLLALSTTDTSRTCVPMAKGSANASWPPSSGESVRTIRSPSRHSITRSPRASSTSSTWTESRTGKSSCRMSSVSGERTSSSGARSTSTVTDTVSVPNDPSRSTARSVTSWVPAGSSMASDDPPSTGGPLHRVPSSEDDQMRERASVLPPGSATVARKNVVVPSRTIVPVSGSRIETLGAEFRIATPPSEQEIARGTRRRASRRMQLSKHQSRDRTMLNAGVPQRGEGRVQILQMAARRRFQDDDGNKHLRGEAGVPPVRGREDTEAR